MNPTNLLQALSGKKGSDSLAQRKFGRFIFSREILDAGQTELQKVFSRVIPTSVEYDFATQLFHVTAVSDEFEPVTMGAVIPAYSIYFKQIYNKKLGRYLTSFKFVKETE